MGINDKHPSDIAFERYQRKRQEEKDRQAEIAKRDKPMQDAVAKAAAEVRAIRGKR